VIVGPGVTAPIIGPTTIAQMHELVAAIDVVLSDEELQYLGEAYQPRPKIMIELSHKS